MYSVGYHGGWNITENLKTRVGRGDDGKIRTGARQNSTDAEGCHRP